MIAALCFAQDVSVLAHNTSDIPPPNQTSQLAREAAERNADRRRLEMAAIEASAPAAVPEYRQVDAFENTTTHKGLQGMMTPEYGGQHTLMNIWIDSYIDDEDPGTFDYCWPYEYNGKTFYIDLSGIEMFMERIYTLNQQNISVSMVFLVRYTEGREFLIDEGSRVPGFKYYAPATTGDGADAFKAFFEFFMWRCSDWNASVDNFILGNEINNPNGWHYSGTLNATSVATKYAAAFYNMYSIVRKYTSVSRCSISLDHNWTHSDHGRQIPGRSMLELFNAALEQLQPGIDWCISYHLYPAIMYNTAIWRWSGYNMDSPYAMFVDGGNLHVLTDYVRDTFGEQHRVMLTEQGFSFYNGNQEMQAASLIVSYYAAKYNPMVDCFILYCETLPDPRLNFSIAGNLAEFVYEMLDNGSDEDKAKIEQFVLENTGRTLIDLVPNYESAPEPQPEPIPEPEPVAVEAMPETASGAAPEATSQATPETASAPEAASQHASAAPQV